MPFVTALDGVRLYYEILGKGHPLILIGGRNSDHLIWDSVRKDFTKHYQVIVYDQRGTGQSDKPEQPPYSTRIFASDAVTILDHLQIQRAFAYGVSMGGAICQWLGIDYPDRFGGLVMACSTAGRSHGLSHTLEIETIMTGKDNSKARGLMFSKRISLNQLQFFYSMRKAGEHPMPLYAEELHKRANQDHDAWDLLPEITAPTLIIQGSDDPVCPSQNASLLAERIPDTELRIFKGGRHLFFIEYRQQVNRLVLDFLKRRN